MLPAVRTRLAVGLLLVAILGAAVWFALEEPAASAAPAERRAALPEPVRSAPSPSPRLIGTVGAVAIADEVTAAEVPAPADAGPVVTAAPSPDDAGSDAARAEALQAWLRRNAAAAEKHVDRYCAESKKVAALEGFSPRPRTRDAAIFMAVRVDWENGRIGLLHLPASLTQRMGNPPMSWRQFTPADYAGLDFGWMHELLDYDYWSLSGDGPLKDLDSASYVDAPIPNYVGLQGWAKLRLLKGRHDGDLVQASVEVRHLGELCGSSGTLIGEMIRLALYGIERGFWEASGLTPPEPPPTADEVQRLRQSAFAGLYFLYPGVPRAVRLKALACIPSRCAALTEAIGATAALRDFLPGTEAELQWLLAQEPCDRDQATRLSRGRALSLAELAEIYPAEGPPIERWLSALTDGGL